MIDDQTSGVNMDNDAAAAGDIQEAPAKAKPVKKTAKKTTKKATKAKAKPAVKTAGDDAPVKAKAPRTKPAPKAPTGPTITTVVHGETRLNSQDDEGRYALQAITDLIDGVHAQGRVRITGGSHGDGVVHLHGVALEAGGVVPANPGVIISIGRNNLASFDDIAVGLATPQLVESIVLNIMAVVGGDDDSLANAIGRRADWHAHAIGAAQRLADLNMAA